MINLPKLIIVLIVLLVSSCNKSSQCFHSSGEGSYEIRHFLFFNKVDIKGIFDTYWHYDTIYMVKIEAPKNSIAYVETNVRGNKLSIIDQNKCKWLRKYNRIKIHIYSPTLEKIIINKSGDLYFIDTLKADSFYIDNWADISKIDAKINCRWFSYSLNAGTGDTYISGVAGISFLWISGMGYLHAKDLISSYTYVTSISTGDCKIYANIEAGVNIYKSGNVFLYGKPQNIIENIRGIGKLYIMP